MVEGTSGAAATKVKVSGVTSCQTPATAGLSEGVGDWLLRGRENCTETVASLGTWVVPAAGVTEPTVNGPDGWRRRFPESPSRSGDAPAPLVLPRVATVADAHRHHGHGHQGDGDDPSPAPGGLGFGARRS